MNATPLQQALYMLAMAWAHLDMLVIAQPKMNELVGDKKGDDRDALLKDNDEAAYYTGKVLASQFYIGFEFPKFFGRAEALMFGESAVRSSTSAAGGYLIFNVKVVGKDGISVDFEGGIRGITGSIAFNARGHCSLQADQGIPGLCRLRRAHPWHPILARVSAFLSPP